MIFKTEPSVTNLSFLGVKESLYETREDLKEVGRNTFSTLLRIKPTFVERIHRLGKSKDDRD